MTATLHRDASPRLGPGGAAPDWIGIVEGYQELAVYAVSTIWNPPTPAAPH